MIAYTFLLFNQIIILSTYKPRLDFLIVKRFDLDAVHRKTAAKYCEIHKTAISAYAQKGL